MQAHVTSIGSGAQSLEMSMLEPQGYESQNAYGVLGVTRTICLCSSGEFLKDYSIGCFVRLFLSKCSLVSRPFPYSSLKMV